MKKRKIGLTLRIAGLFAIISILIIVLSGILAYQNQNDMPSTILSQVIQ